jgi:hypothetical protein
LTRGGVVFIITEIMVNLITNNLTIKITEKIGYFLDFAGFLTGNSGKRSGWEGSRELSPHKTIL